MCYLVHKVLGGKLWPRECEAPKMTVHKKDDKFQLSSMSYRQALRVQILSQIDGSQDPNPYFLH